MAMVPASYPDTTTSRVAERLADLYRRGEFAVACAELFADNAVSIEPAPSGGEVGDKHAALRQAARPFVSRIQRVHAIDVDEPLVAGNRFSVSMSLDATVVGRGRLTLDELRVYCLVAGDKIVSEQFFYTIED